jgi:hypothetical protein
MVNRLFDLYADTRLQEALALHAEIEDLVVRERVVKYGLCMRLGRMRRDRLWWELTIYPSFPKYAVKVGAADSCWTATQLADLADLLLEQPLMRASFEAGRADWTKLREAAPAVTPETEAEWVQIVERCSYDEVKRLAQVAQGKTPTKRLFLEVPLEDDARFQALWNTASERAGARLTKAEFFRGLLDIAARAEPEEQRGAWFGDPRLRAEDAGPPGGELGDATTETPSSGPPPEVATAMPASPAAPETDALDPRPWVFADDLEIDEFKSPLWERDGTPPASRVPGPAYCLHLHGCTSCGTVETDGPDGGVLMSTPTADALSCDPWVQDEEGHLRRKIPEHIRRKIYHRDRGRCRVPTCGARGFLHNHHQGGWRQVGHDPDLLMLLCAVHHGLHHDGRMLITGRDSTGFRFFRRDGLELVAPMRVLWKPTPVAVESGLAPRRRRARTTGSSRGARRD